MKISTPYLRGGILYADFKHYFGSDSPTVLVWSAPSWVMNASLTDERLARERRLDPTRFDRKYGAQFTDAANSFLASDVLEGAPSRGAMSSRPAPVSAISARSTRAGAGQTPSPSPWPISRTNEPSLISSEGGPVPRTGR